MCTIEAGNLTDDDDAMCTELDEMPPATSLVDSSTQTEATETCTVCKQRSSLVMRSVDVSTDDVELAAVMQHDHPYVQPAKPKQLVGVSPGPATTAVGTSCEAENSDGDYDKDKDSDDDDDNHDDDNDENNDGDNDDVDYIPDSPSSDSDSDHGQNSGTTSDVDLIKEDKYIVFSSQLLYLFQKCNHPGCGKPIVEPPKTSKRGFALTISTSCLDGHSFIWHTQPLLGKAYAGNIILPAAIFISGNSYSTFTQTCRAVSLQTLSTRQCFNIQHQYIIPEVERAWTKHNEAVLATLADEEITVSGDARCDSPGHSATLGTYTLLESSSHLIVAQESVHVTEVKNSYWLEPEGLKRCLGKVLDHGVKVSVLATDRHPTVQKQMREEHPEITHEYDLWHIAKGVKKRLANSKNHELSVWIQAIVNHLWYSVASCGGDVLLLKEKWISILHHITDHHSWRTGQKINKCEHTAYTREERKSRPWLSKTSKAFSILQSVVLDKKLLRDLEKVITELFEPL